MAFRSIEDAKFDIKADVNSDDSIIRQRVFTNAITPCRTLFIDFVNFVKFPALSLDNPLRFTYD